VETVWKEIQEKVQKKQHPGVTGMCWEHPHAPVQTGYVQLNFNGKKKYGVHQGNYSVHLLAMRAVGRTPRADLKDRDCSHLCHNKICCNPDHLVWEEGENNKRRNVCPHKVDGVLICPSIHHGPPCAGAHRIFEKNAVVFTGY
jgi:hypothetical protein